MNTYDLILLDLQIPSRPGGRDRPEFGKNLLKQIRKRFGHDVAAILMTAEYQQCVDMMSDLQESGIEGSICKPFPATGRTLAVVIEDVLEKHRRSRSSSRNIRRPDRLTPFSGGVLAYYPRHIALCGETIAEKTRRGYAWQILQALRQLNGSGRHVHLSSRALARKMMPEPEQNTLIRAVCSLRSRVAKIVQCRLGQTCGKEDIIANDDQGYHLADSICVEVYDDDGILQGG